MQSLDEMEWERGLWGSAMSGDVAKCERLLDKGGVAADDRDSSGYAALHYAARAGKLEVCRLLVGRHHADVNATTCKGLATPLHRAAYMGHDDICTYLIEKGARVRTQGQGLYLLMPFLTPLACVCRYQSKTTTE